MRDVRLDFPILNRKLGGRNLVYLDNAATSQKPQQVISAISDFYQNHNANVHRGSHLLADEATAIYEDTRAKVARFINANSPDEIVFVRNTTEAINLLAYTIGKETINKNDEIITTIMDHHSNFVPWQQLALENNCVLKVVDITKDGRLDWTKNIITPKTKILALTHVSNVLGTINPVKEIIHQARQQSSKIIVIVDGAQAAPHLKINVRDLDCDFYAFSGHKMFGPMGVGILWGRKSLLEQTPPFLFGGGMIRSVQLSRTDFGPSPYKFEAGTPSVADAAGLGAAIDYLSKLNMDQIIRRESQLTKLLIDRLAKIPELTIYGPKNIRHRVGTISFTIEKIHPHDIAQFLNDNYAIAIRAGHHCAMPLHERLKIPATARISLAFYNTEEEINILITGIRALIKKLNGHL